jgi:acetolactate synthase-1/2/3 large subunit
MGFGIPAAIGAKLARPDAPVVCVTGDGGLLMSGFEILTAVREQISVVFVVFNDGHLGLIRHGQRKRYGREECVKLRVPNLELLAESYGIPYSEIKRDHDSRTVMRSVLEKGGPYLVNVSIKYERLSPFADQVNRSTFLEMSLKDKVGSVFDLAKSHLKSKLRNK